MATIINRSGSSVIIHLTATQGATTVDALAGEDVTGLNISQVWWGTTGNWVIDRTTSGLLVLTESGHFDFAGDGCALTHERTADITATLTGTGFLIMELQKVF
jgi:hypothetical protein